MGADDPESVELSVAQLHRSVGQPIDAEWTDLVGRLAQDGSLPACEVKGRQIKLDEIDQKLIELRGKDLAAALFLVKTGVSGGQPSEILRKHFASGIDAQVMDLVEFAQPLLFLVGIPGRYEFLKGIGIQLDGMNVQLPIRRKWADLLREQ